MVSQKLIKSLDFQNITEYFDYIIDSIINDNKQQAKELFVKLSSKQKLKFFFFLSENNFSPKYYEILKTLN
jgi:hypothetical protein